MALPKIIENIDARVKKTGDTMTGNLTISSNNFLNVGSSILRDNFLELNNSKSLIQGGNDYTLLSLYERNENQDYRYIGVFSPDLADIKHSVRFAERVNNKQTDYLLYGQHNHDLMPFLSTSGGILSGGLEIKNTGPMFTMTNTTSGGDMRLYPSGNSTILLNREVAGNSNNYRALYLHNSKATTSLLNALVLQTNENGSVNNYNVLHAGNYNNYSPTLSGGGAYGTWNIYAKAIEQQDTRSVNETPDTMQEGITLHLKQNDSSDGLSDGGKYHAAIHVKDWGDYSGAPFGEIALTDNKNMWFRISESQDTWSAWRKVVTTPEFSSPGVGMPYILALSLMNAGFGLHSDPEFSSGDNNVSIYNNSSNGTVTITRTADSTCGNSTGYIMRVKHTGSASPGFGGFWQCYTSRANAVFCQIFRAKIPVGYYLDRASNSMGNSYQDRFLTEVKGTGKWEWYVRLTLCGKDGTFSTGSHVYLQAFPGYPAPTSSAPITWDISYCNAFDLTKGGAINAGMGTDYTTARARNISANTSGSPGGNGEIFIRY